MLGDFDTYQKQLSQGGKYEKLPMITLATKPDQYTCSKSQSFYTTFDKFWTEALFQGGFILRLICRDGISRVAYVGVYRGSATKERQVYLRRWIMGSCRTVYLCTGNTVLPNRLISELVTIFSGVLDIPEGVYYSSWDESLEGYQL